MRSLLFPLEEGYEGNRGSPLVKGVLRVGFEDIEFLLDEVVFGMKAERTNGGDAQICGKFEDLGFQARFVVDRANGMAHEDVPCSDSEFAGYGHGGFVAAAAESKGKTPLAQGVFHLEKTLRSLNQEGANGTASVTLEGSSAFPIPALGDAGVEAQVGHQFFGVGEAVDIADGAGQSVNADEVESGEAGQTQEFGIRSHFQGHLVAELLTTGAGTDESGVHLFQKQELNGTPGFEGSEPIDGARSSQAEAGRQAQAVFVEHAFDVLLQAGGFFDNALVGAEEFSPLASLPVGLPDDRRESAEVDAGDFDRIDPIIGTVGLADLASHLAFQNDGMVSDGLETCGHGKSVAAGFHDKNVVWSGMSLRPGLQLGERHPGG